MSATLLILLMLVAIAVVIALIVARPRGRSLAGRVLPLLGLLVLPLLLTAGGGSHHLERSKSTEFCMTCHVMEPYGQSVRVEDPVHLPAIHFQNRLVDREHACFTCHTTYAMYGDIKAKMAGAKHMWVYYFGTPDQPLELYEPYQNRECLHCHDGARNFEQNEFHAEIREELAAQETSCLDCHGPAHDVGSLEAEDEVASVGEGVTP